MDRRRFVSGAVAAGAALSLRAAPASAALAERVTRTVPATGARIPVIGMGSWITFNVGRSERLRQARLEVLEAFFEAGGGMIDSSPMYGSSEDVIGWCLKRVSDPGSLFSATKVWTLGRDAGIGQMEASERLWGERPFDLLQVHNLVDWQVHLETLRTWKAEGRVRHVGVTTSHGRRHEELAEVMQSQPIDFVQLTYNIADREAERRLLPLAADKGLAVILNRPFRRGRLIDRLESYPLPEWASEIGCANWPQFLLKFAVSHPAVTCAIPATSRVEHMRENMGAALDPMPDEAMRKRMAAYVDAL